MKLDLKILNSKETDVMGLLANKYRETRGKK